MISEKMQKALNDQIQAEMFSSYLYLSMSACFHNANMDGMAHWMNVQAKEENSHAMKIFGYIVERGGSAIPDAIEKPPVEFDGPVDVFEKTLAHEQYITGCIHNLYGMAVEEKDYASLSTLQWFVDEQVEEEETASGILELLKMTGDKGQGLLMLDRQLGGRGG